MLTQSIIKNLTRSRTGPKEQNVKTQITKSNYSYSSINHNDYRQLAKNEDEIANINSVKINIYHT